jgi:hypothetical protein
MMKFIPFVEENEWEGETWRFWLQVDGNEAELEKLRAVLAEIEALYDDSEPGAPFTLGPANTLHDEDFVNKVCDLADEDEGGYMAAHQKVTGVLTVPDWPAPEDFGSRAEQDLYKGGIRALFRETATA